MKRKYLNYLKIFIVSSIFSISCTQNNVSDNLKNINNLDKDSLQKIDTIGQKDLNDLSFSMPSPMEMLSYFDKTEINLNLQLLNPVESKASYITKDEKLLNIGIYSADLAYLVLMKQSKEVSYYYKVLEDLSVESNLQSAFDDKMKKRLMKNAFNNDSVINLANDIYVKTIEKIYETNQQGSYALISAGVFVETMYLVAHSIKKEHENQTIEKLMKQKLLFDDLFSMLFKLKNIKIITATTSDISDLKLVYDKISLKSEKVSLDKVDSTNYELTGRNTMKYPQELIKELKSTLLKLRTKWTLKK